MGRNSVKIKGLKQAIDAIGKLPLEVANKVQKKAVAAGARVIRDAIALGIVSQGLVRTGRMLGKIRIKYHRDQYGRTFASVGLQRARIWHLHEFGTSKMRARPFIRPALAAAEAPARSAVEKVVRRELVKIAKRKVGSR